MSSVIGHYRRDVDGLRALAVVPVVLFHAGVPGLAGGFVGVDVFFVISGFLITGILQSDLTEGRFSIISFYDRRIRRIFPALLLVLVTTTVACVLLMTPLALRAFARELAGTALFASNFVFAAQNGYFAAAAHEKPLLHTWSLAVEEQFYIFWPIVLWLWHRHFRTSMFAMAVLICLGSFAASIWWTHNDASDAFYLPQTRIWELMIGAALALRPIHIRGHLLREALSLFGLVLIIASIVGLDEQSSFPGPMALIPCIGAALCLVANRNGDTIGARLLSLKPMVFVGLISYSLYLWHWPLMALARYRLLGDLPVQLGLALCVASLALAALSWQFVEQRFRRPAHGAREQGRTLAIGGVAVLGALVVAGLLFGTKGLPQRAPAGVTFAEQAGRDKSTYATRCGTVLETGRCWSGQQRTAHVVVWGDSHARAFAPVVERATSDAGLSMRLYTQPGCPPLLGVERTSFGEKALNCLPGNRAAFAEIAGNTDVRAVILAARWSFYTEAKQIGAEGGALPYLIDDPRDELSVTNSRRVMAQGLDRTISAIRKAVGPNVPIILIGSVPEMELHVPDCFARRRMWGEPSDPCDGLDRAEVDERQAFPREVINSAAARWANVTIYSLADRMCGTDFCATRRGDTFLYVDNDHLSLTGSLAIAEDFSLRLLPLEPSQ